MDERIVELQDVADQGDELRDKLCTWELLPDGRLFAILNGSRPAKAYTGGLDVNGEWQDGLWEIDGGGFCASGQEPSRAEAIDRARSVHLALVRPRPGTLEGWTLGRDEGKKALAWCEEHDKKHSGGHAAIGGRYTFSFTPTTLGTVAKVTCACGENIDLTNYEEW